MRRVATVTLALVFLLSGGLVVFSWAGYAETLSGNSRAVCGRIPVIKFIGDVVQARRDAFPPATECTVLNPKTGETYLIHKPFEPVRYFLVTIIAHVIAVGAGIALWSLWKRRRGSTRQAEMARA